VTVGLLIVTHDQIGGALLRTASRMLGKMPLPTRVLPVTIDAIPEKLVAKAQLLVTKLNDGDGVLVLTDMYGSTPSNIAFGLMKPGKIHVISGINLPMLIRTLNYATLDLVTLTHKAISGAREGIFCCTKTEHNFIPHAEP
jgi:PTS system ascorbate-specific IIA component